jgi:hypothetical protein
MIRDLRQRLDEAAQERQRLTLLLTHQAERQPPQRFLGVVVRLALCRSATGLTVAGGEAAPGRGDLIFTPPPIRAGHVQNFDRVTMPNVFAKLGV